MRYLDFTSLLEGEAAELALLATFQFDPDFFERRVLRSPSLAKARRIVVFVDRREWLQLQTRDVLARGLNRRYLVVPVHCAKGVFHPKLTLILRRGTARVLCGSNNLTRSGCAANLELLNSIDFDAAHEDESARGVVVEAVKFFERAAQEADPEIARIATSWIAEEAARSWWVTKPVSTDERSLRLVHSYAHSLWDELVASVGPRRPKEFLVMSPFHDADGRLLRRLSDRWPEAAVNLVVQQGYTAVPVASVKRLSRVRLSELVDTSRRLHAKLIAWRDGKGAGCLVGSANFTSAAFDGNNAETCFILKEAKAPLDGLFDRELPLRPLPVDEFEPGIAEEPLPKEQSASPLRVESAVLNTQGRLRVSYANEVSAPVVLSLTLFSAGEARPRAALPLSGRRRSTESVVVSESALADVHGTLMCALRCEVNGEVIQSPPVWVVQEDRLTYEAAEGGGGGGGRVEETGEGLQNLLDEIGSRQGAGAVIEYLRGLNIRFSDGEGGSWSRRRFRIKIRDPFKPDVSPEWLRDRPHSTGLARAVLEFADRHEKRRLRKHARRGNVNGIENFVDILTTLVDMLYVHVQRGVLKPANLVARVTTYIEIGTTGSETADPPFPGFISGIAENLVGDRQTLRQACEESNYFGELRAALLMAQSVRAQMDGPARDPGDVLPTGRGLIAKAAAMVGVRQPSPGDVREALESYRRLTADEIERLLGTLR